MKYILFLLLLVFGTFPTHAQRGQGLRTWLKSWKMRPSVAAQVEQRAARQAVQTSVTAGMRLAKIANLPGTPLVQVQFPEGDGPQGTDILPARVLKPSEVYKAISLTYNSQLCVPAEFATPDGAIYRGLKLNNLAELKNILVHGMEIKKSHFPEIYASYSLGVALGFSVSPFEWATYENLPDIDFELPTVVKIPVTIRLLEKNTPYESNGDVFFRQDIWPDLMSDVMVFLEVDGKPGWYRATLQDKNLVLIYSPTKNIEGWIEEF